MKIANVLRALKQRWGSSSVKSDVWDEEYAAGKWDHCERTPESMVYEYVLKYCKGGSILDLGCGSGNTGNELDASKYSNYTGVDISEVALEKASSRSQTAGRASKNTYLQSDIVSFAPKQKYDVILFRESIYYIPKPKMKAALKRYASYLTEKGVFVVHVSRKGITDKKINWILSLIRAHFDVKDVYHPSGAEEVIVIFSNQHGNFPH